MISFEEALKLILTNAYTLPAVCIPFEDSLGRALAQPVTARCDMPLFDQSAVDGYAVRASEVTTASRETPVSLRLTGEVAAGSGKVPRLRSGCAIRVLTGGRIPTDADSVVMKEFCTIVEDQVLITSPTHSSENIRFRGEEYRKGDRMLAQGTRITPPVMGLLAEFGLTRVVVHRSPMVSLVVTGNELIEPSGRLKRGQIRDSNTYSLSAALLQAGVCSVRCYRSADVDTELQETLAQALKTVDVVITVGGVSVGEYDLVKDKLGNLGVETVFWRVAVKPGMPLYFGVRKRRSGNPQLIFGLPGNPVSALLLYKLMVEPALRRMMGDGTPEPHRIRATLRGSLSKKPGRLEWVRAVLYSEDGSLIVVPTSGQGSHMIGGLAGANCLIRFPQESRLLPDGSEVEVTMLDWRA